MNVREIRKIAFNILGDYRTFKDISTDILVFSDLMEELGDIRHVAVRKHAKCYQRGINIIDFISNYGIIIKNINEFVGINSIGQEDPNPETWDCVI